MKNIKMSSIKEIVINPKKESQKIEIKSGTIFLSISIKNNNLILTILEPVKNTKKKNIEIFCYHNLILVSSKKQFIGSISFLDNTKLLHLFYEEKE